MRVYISGVSGMRFSLRSLLILVALIAVCCDCEPVSKAGLKTDALILARS